jgi:cytochrome c peroxidase
MKCAGVLVLMVGTVVLQAACDRPTSPVDPLDAAFSQATASQYEQLGEAIFFDMDLSINQNQSCASCHDPAWGFTGPIAAFNAEGAVYEGSIAGRFGDRKPPSAAYATVSPILYFGKDGFVGGNFWDGRATGEKLGNPAADQAQGPFLNPKEQGLPDMACVVYRVSRASYKGLYDQAFPGNSLSSIAFPTDVETVCATEGTTVSLSASDRDAVYQEYDRIALAIAGYEGSPVVNAFTSKFDAWRGGGGARLTKDELRGFSLFQGKGKCQRCHPSAGKEPLFTDFTYDNLGVPANLKNPALLADPSFVDKGLGGFLQAAGYPASVWMEEMGKVKVPTLRNVDRRPMGGGMVKAYMHNGVFKSLKEVVHFYNTRDVLPDCATVTGPPVIGTNCWPAPEIAQNVNTDELGDLGLTADEEDAIVAFLKTLSDGFMP